VKGWTEALQLMTAGEKWELYVPPQLVFILVFAHTSFFLFFQSRRFILHEC
jgi:hypothetical protein